MSYRYARDPQTDESLHRSVRDGVAWSVMFGAGESYFAAFAVFLRATTAQISLLAALPSLLGALAQLAAAWVAGRVGRRKPLILAGVWVQTLMWLPIAALAFVPSDYTVTLLIVCVAIYYIGGQFAAPPWSSLISDLVPERRRGRFFARRTRYMSFATFVSLSVAGLTLEFLEQRELAAWGFALLFAVAIGGRLYSLTQLMRMHEPRRQLAPLTLPPLAGLLPRLLGTDFARFAWFVAAMNLAVAIASPFFTLYMLRDLQFSYFVFTAVSAFYVLVQFVALKVWGRLADVYGNRLIMRLTTTVFPLLPLMWVLLPTFWFILSIQIVSGACWAGFSLAAGNYLYDIAPPEKRAAYSAIHQALSNAAIFCGALLGGYLGTQAPLQLDLGATTLDFTSGLWAVMVVSGLARALAAAVFLPRLREVRPVREVSATALALRVTRANVVAGWLFELLPGRRPSLPSWQLTQMTKPLNGALSKTLDKVA
jgi:MFS family permease